MTGTMANQNLEKFQNLLRVLFQFDCADLDFGIYRIMNYKREVVEQFIAEKLPATVADQLNSGPLAEQARAQSVLQDAAQRVRENLVADAIDDLGNLSEQYHATQAGRDYLAAQAAAADGSRNRDAVESDIYNHLWTFFSRYYEEGDFISKRRYSRNERYAIPYNGEEVYLHWANSDQYYVKSDEHFRNYDWQAPNGVTVRFRLLRADVEQNNIKGDKRFFLPLVDKVEWDSAARVVTIPFEYRPLSSGETRRYGKQKQQDKIIDEATTNIPKSLDQDSDVLAALTGQARHNGNGPVSHLEHHLHSYVQRSNADFFIHKDLSGFLNRELDFYLKNEVLNLDNMTVAGENMADGWFQTLRLVKEVGGRIIDFLAQIENFQKMLYEKRKFITETQYCITLGNINAEFYPDIVTNDAQWEEWRDLFGVDGVDRNNAFLETHSTVVLDTKYFCSDFTDRLLESISDLDAKTDGLLVHGENWHALRLLEATYQGKVKCVYIDPPYNSPSSEIIYKNGYKHSTWLSLLENSVALSRAFMSSDDGSFVCAVDENEMLRLGLMLDAVFSNANYERNCITVVHNPKGIQGGFVSINNEYAFVISPAGARSKDMRIPQEEWKYEPLRNWGGESERNTARNCFYPIAVKDGEITYFGDVLPDDVHPHKNVALDDGTVLVYPIDRTGTERKWTYSRQSVDSIRHLLRPTKNKDGTWDIERTHDRQRFKTVWSKSEYIAGDYGSKPLNQMIGQKRFDFPKAIPLVEDCLRLSDGDNYLAMDYFAGSGTTGHAVINLNREDGGKRKFVLVEMGEYFDTVLLPRIKKAIFVPDWKQWRSGSPKRNATPEEVERSPGIVKYVRLESYEDALDSIEFDDVDGQQAQLRLTESDDAYLLKYMLRWETKGSATLLNVGKLDSPFDYCLRAHVNGAKQTRKVDLPETFNYLLGLNVRTRHSYDNDGRRYLVYRGETRDTPGRTVAVIWRVTENWNEEDFARDRDFIAAENLAADADTVYVNGDSCIPGAKPIEPMFKARMFAGVDA